MKRGGGRRRAATGGAGRLLLAAAAAAVLVFAAALSYAAGRRGLFAFDQSILFDAGHRMLRGQVPFRDFVLPFGPLAPALQAAFFSLLGVDWAAYLAAAAAANAAAAALAMLLLRALLPRRPLLWLFGGALTAVWFYPLSGTPWFDQTAFLFVLAAVVLLLPAVLHPSPGRNHLAAAAAAGVCLVLAALSKQNAGVAALPLAALLAVLPVALPLASPRRLRPRLGDLRPFLALLAGGVLAAAVFALWLCAAADPDLFLRYAVHLPAQEGLRRLAADPWRLVTGRGPWAFRLALGGCTVLAVASGLAAGDQRGRVGAAVAVGLLVAQHLFTATSYNQPEICAPFTGLLPPLALGSWLRPRPALPRRAVRLAIPPRLRWTVSVVLVAVALLLAARGLEASWRRSVHDVFPAGTEFDRPLAVAALQPLLWGRPTLLDGEYGDPAARVEAQDLETLVAALRARPGRFFAFPDWTLLYGVLDRPAPQPVLWFHPGLTYPAGRAGDDSGDAARRDLDRWIVADLERHRVETVVVETTSWFGTASRLADFPRLAAYLDRCFTPVESHGIFELRARRAGCRPPP